MKSCHTAALALVVWYLMFAPIDPASRFDPTVSVQQLDVKAPLHTWWVADTFNTSDQRKAAIASMNLKPGDYWYGKYQCVSNDDPRVKGRQLNFVPESKLFDRVVRLVSF
jgi:hypothetical protein